MNEAEAKSERQVGMFGMSVENVQRAFAEARKMSRPAMILMSILSDVQELVARDDKEAARQKLNCVKYLISNAVEVS